MIKRLLLMLMILSGLLACGDDSDYGTVGIVYMEAQTYSDSILRTREPAIAFTDDFRVVINKDLLRQPVFRGSVPVKADLGGSPVAGIYIEWSPDRDADGYVVYAGDRVSGLSTVTNLDSSYSYFYYYIPSPDFNTEYGIRIEAVKAGYYPKTSSTEWISLLGEYTLTLTSPGDYSTLTTLTPTFTWTADPVPGSTGRLDYFRIRQVSGTFSFSTAEPLRDVSSYIFRSTAMARGTLYEWDIYKSLAYKLHDANATRVSVSFPRMMNGDGDAGSNNGAWYFTVTE